MNSIKVSIIVPVYNVEEYLVKCLDSLINQTLKEIEIICINDGSTDNSLEILNAYAQKDSRIKVINKENEGVSAARNIGLAQAQGEYVMFVDSDDYLELKACENIYEKAMLSACDLIIFSCYSVNDKTKNKAKELNTLNGIEDFYFQDAPDDFFYINTGVWSKLYKNYNLGKFNFDLKKGEDTVFFWEYCLNNNPKISVLNEYLYDYCIRSTGAMRCRCHFENCETFKSIDYLTNSPYFRSASERIKAFILDRWAISIAYELKCFDEFTTKNVRTKYYKKIKCFLKLLKTYDINFRNKLKYQVKISNYGKYIKFANKIFYVTNKDRHKVINLAGVRFKFKYLKGQAKLEQKYIDKILKNQNKCPKDTYLLFDCLHDETVECIDAYSLFQYLRSIGKKAYYVLLENSYLYMKLKMENNLDGIVPLAKSSREYPGDMLKEIYEILLKTKAVITSFGENTPITNKFFKNNPYWQYIFIQHGPTFLKESVLVSGYLIAENFDKFLVSSSNEAGIFRKYAFEENKLLKVGLPRWDLLCDLPEPLEKSILIMLTWRHFNPLLFEESLYKKNLLSLLNNKDLQECLQVNNVTVYFAQHHALSANCGIDFQPEFENIKLVDMQNISTYIKHCSCLVTDFSSVAFDFMFQNKPVVFYILDKGDSHLKPFEQDDIERMNYKQYIMPNILFDEDSVVEKIKYYVENNFELEPITKQKYDKFFYTKENIRAKLVEEIDRVCSEIQT